MTNRDRLQLASMLYPELEKRAGMAWDIGREFIPGIGFKDAYGNFRAGGVGNTIKGFGNMAMGALSLLPGVGGLAAKGLKLGVGAIGLGAKGLRLGAGGLGAGVKAVAPNLTSSFMKNTQLTRGAASAVGRGIGQAATGAKNLVTGAATGVANMTAGARGAFHNTAPMKWLGANSGKTMMGGIGARSVGEGLEGLEGSAKATESAIESQGNSMKGIMEQMRQNPVFQNPAYAQPQAQTGLGWDIANQFLGQ